MGEKVTTLFKGNFRDPVFALRSIADAIESGELGPVRQIGLVTLGYTMEVYGIGPDAEAPSIGLLLHSGFMRLSQAIEQTGTEEPG